jgi:hypothetical protein
VSVPLLAQDVVLDRMSEMSEMTPAMTTWLLVMGPKSYRRPS